MINSYLGGESQIFTQKVLTEDILYFLKHFCNLLRIFLEYYKSSDIET